MQPAELLVDVDKSGREPGEAAVAQIGGIGHIDRVEDRAAEALEALVDLAFLSELVERLLGLDDLVLGLAVDLHAGRLLGDLLADQDQVAADGEVVDQLRIVPRGEERDRRAREAHEIGGTAEGVEPGIGLEEGLERDRGRERVLLDALAGHLEDPRMHRVEEMLRPHDSGDPVIDVVVDEQRAEQCLFGLDVARKRLRKLGGGGSVGHESVSFGPPYSPKPAKRAPVKPGDSGHGRKIRAPVAPGLAPAFPAPSKSSG